MAAVTTAAIAITAAVTIALYKYGAAATAVTATKTVLAASVMSLTPFIPMLIGGGLILAFFLMACLSDGKNTRHQIHIAPSGRRGFYNPGFGYGYGDRPGSTQHRHGDGGGGTQHRHGGDGGGTQHRHGGGNGSTQHRHGDGGGGTQHRHI